MNEPARDLLYRSLDGELSAAEEEVLQAALAESAELRAERASLLALRAALKRAAPRSFGPFFPERVMARIRSRVESGSATESLWQAIRPAFRWVAAVTAPIAVLLIIWNVQPRSVDHQSAQTGVSEAEVVWETPLERMLGDAS